MFVFVRRGDEYLVLHRAPPVGEPYAYPIEEEPRYRLLVPPGRTEIVVGTFLVEAPAGWEPRLDHEHHEYCWCSREDALSLLYWPEPREILASL